MQVMPKDKYRKRVAIAGAGYVGLSVACLLAAESDVALVDVVSEKVDLLNSGCSPIDDLDIQSALDSGKLHLQATADGEAAYRDADIIVIAVPTNYDDMTGYFDTSFVDDVINLAFSVNPEAAIVIKSTIPIGFTERSASEHPGCRLLFSPEFLREGKALYDNLHPSRIIVGIPAAGAATEDDAQVFAELLAEGAEDSDPPVIIMGSTEAETVKLFSNTYLATRVAFFNELDTYAEAKGLDPALLIKGVTLDPRIGQNYCNPSFGYGGYCLPKDTKQLLADFGSIPQSLIGAVVDSNSKRKEYIAARIRKMLRERGAGKGTVGAYRLTMKLDSDNFRSSAIQDVIAHLRNDGYTVLIYEPTLQEESFLGCHVVGDIGRFKDASDIVIANRLHDELEDIMDKVYTRDCFRGAGL